VPYVRDEIKRLGQSYINKMDEHANIFTINLVKQVKTARRLKKKPPQHLIVLYLIIL